MKYSFITILRVLCVLLTICCFNWNDGISSQTQTDPTSSDFRKTEWPEYADNPFVFPVEEPVLDEQFFVVELNNDGLIDFVYRSETAVLAYDHYGDHLWSTLVENPFGGNSGTKHAAADVDGDGKVEVLALNRSNQVIILNGENGKQKKKIDLPSVGVNNRWVHIAVVNLRGRGDRDIIVQTLDTTGVKKSFYVNRNLLAWDLENNEELWRVEQDTDHSNGIYEGYWGVAHGSFQCADVDGDGMDEVVGGNMINHDGTVIDLGYPRDWVGTLYNGFTDHFDALSIGDFRSDLPNLEWIITEEDHSKKTDWHTTLLSASGIIWRKETNLFEERGKEPQNIAGGNFKKSFPQNEVWVRSRFVGPIDSQHPWIFNAFGNEFADYSTEDVLPEGFSTHQYGNKEGIEIISTIDWFGGDRDYLAVKARHVHGNIGVFDAISGEAVWYTLRDFPETRATFIYVADIAGDSREEVIIYDESGEIRIYSNQRINKNLSKKRKWEDPLYRRFKQNWNYYSPAGYVRSVPDNETGWIDTVETHKIIEAEFANDPSTGYSTENEWIINNRGYLGHRLYFTNTATFSIDVFAKGEPVNSLWPEMQIKIDGIPLAIAKVDHQNNWKKYRFFSKVKSGLHHLQVWFLNDSDHRELHLDKLEITTHILDEHAFMESLANSMISEIPMPENFSIMDWTIVNALYGMLRAYQISNNTTYLDYIQRWADAHIDEDGNYDRPINDLFPAGLLLELYQITGEERYLKAGLKARDYMENEYQRLENGALVHVNGDQIWDDTLFGVVRFLIPLSVVLDEPDILTEAADQILLHAEILQDSVTGLFYHGWDQDGSAAWADPVTHLSPDFWGRGNGWVIASTVDLLEMLPVQHPYRNPLIGVIKNLAKGLSETQDSSGMWYTILNKPELSGNYLETSATSLFVYGLQKAIKLGFLPDKYSEQVSLANDALNRMTYINDSGIYYTTNISEGTNVGSTDYYLGRKIGNGFQYKYGHGVYMEAKYAVISSFASQLKSISGNTRYYNNNFPIPDVAINFSGTVQDSEITSQQGEFSFQVLQQEGSLTVSPSKSAGEDVGYSTILSYDVMLTATHVVGLKNLSPLQQIAADVDRDGEILSFDAMAIARYAVGLPPLLNTYVGHWNFQPQEVHLDLQDTSDVDIQFLGIVMGDVKGGWRKTFADSSSQTHFIGKNTVQKNDTTLLNFDFNARKQTLSFDLWLNFPENIFHDFNVKITPDGSQFSILKNVTQRALRLSGYTLMPLKDEQRLCVALVSKERDRLGDITIEKFVLNNNLLIGDVLVSTDETQLEGQIPRSFLVWQNYPNPFNSETVIPYALPSEGEISIKVFDVLGRLVKILEKKHRAAGRYQVIWNGRHQSGDQASAGIYFVRLLFQKKTKHTIKISYLP